MFSFVHQMFDYIRQYGADKDTIPISEWQNQDNHTHMKLFRIKMEFGL